MVLLQVVQRLAQLGGCAAIAGNRSRSSPSWVGGRGGAEPMTEQQQVSGRWHRRLAGGQGLPSHGQCFTQPVVDGE
jgi:hypothetical protein